MCPATALFDQLLSIARRPVVNPRLAPVAAYLRSCHVYSSFSVDYTVGCLDRGMPLGEMFWLETEDVEAIEGMLGGDDHGCVPGCEECEDGARYRRSLLRGSGAGGVGRGEGV